MHDLIKPLIVVLLLPLVTYAAWRGWQEDRHAEAIALFMFGWGIGGVILIAMVYRFFALLWGSSDSLPMIPVPILLGLGIVGEIGGLWLLVLSVHRILKNKEDH